MKFHVPMSIIIILELKLACGFFWQVNQSKQGLALKLLVSFANAYVLLKKLIKICIILGVVGLPLFIKKASGISIFYCNEDVWFTNQFNCILLLVALKYSKFHGQWCRVLSYFSPHGFQYAFCKG